MDHEAKMVEAGMRMVDLMRPALPPDFFDDLTLRVSPAEGVPGLWDAVAPTREVFRDLTTHQVHDLAYRRGWLVKVVTPTGRGGHDDGPPI